MKERIKIMLSCMALAVYVVFAVGCKSAPTDYYQVFNVESDNVSVQEKQMVYSNADCEITYYLWAQGGDLSFAFKNKTDHDLYFINTRSFLVNNGLAMDYYDPNVYSNSTTGTSYDQSVSTFNLFDKSLASGSFTPTPKAAPVPPYYSTKTSSVTFKSPETICIPAHSTKVIKGFPISNSVKLDCEENANDFPATISPEITYTRENSPLSLRNIIAYNTTDKEEGCKTIENTFWISSYKNYSDQAAKQYVEYVDCVSGLRATDLKFWTISKPNAYYNVYNKQTNRGMKPKAGKSSSKY